MRARVVRVGEVRGLTLIDVDGDAPLIAPMPLLRGGPGWLREGVSAATAVHDEQVPEADAEAPTPELDKVRPPVPIAEQPPLSRPDAPVAAELGEIRDELNGLRGAFARLSRELRAGTDLETLDQPRDEAAELTAELQRERHMRRERDTTINGLRLELREARANRATTVETQRTRPDAWPDAEQSFRFEVHATWAARTTAADKARYPLEAYVLGPQFLRSLETLDDGHIDKTLRTVVDVVTGRAPHVAGRRLHRLRYGPGGDNPALTRNDGGTSWRASIETHAASARRLHYWQTPNQPIELSRVVLHDDYEA